MLFRSLGVVILAVVIAGNIPALVWSLARRKLVDDVAAQAGIFS